MKTIVLTLALLIPVTAFAQPAIVFESKTHDFGEVEQGAVLEHEFEFTNEGSEELVIIELKSS
jgi:hypothetical protein